MSKFEPGNLDMNANALSCYNRAIQMTFRLIQLTHFLISSDPWNNRVSMCKVFSLVKQLGCSFDDTGGSECVGEFCQTGYHLDDLLEKHWLVKVPGSNTGLGIFHSIGKTYSTLTATDKFFTIKM